MLDIAMPLSKHDLKICYLYKPLRREMPFINMIANKEHIEHLGAFSVEIKLPCQ